MDKAKRFRSIGGIAILFLLGFLILSHLGTWIRRLKEMPDPVDVEEDILMSGHAVST